MFSDYPAFYEKLYALFDRNMLHTKYRERFLKLSDLFLNSSHLPAYLVAAFVKKLCRLSLYASPPAILCILAMVRNLLKRHPACHVLVHRTSASHGDNVMGEDPYDFSTADPALSRALQSSLWELMGLKDHYHPDIKRMAQSFHSIIDPAKQMPIPLDKYFDLSYVKVGEFSKMGQLF